MLRLACFECKEKLTQSVLVRDIFLLKRLAYLSNTKLNKRKDAFAFNFIFINFRENVYK